MCSEFIYIYSCLMWLLIVRMCNNTGYNNMSLIINNMGGGGGEHLLNPFFHIHVTTSPSANVTYQGRERAGKC